MPRAEILSRMGSTSFWRNSSGVKSSAGGMGVAFQKDFLVTRFGGQFARRVMVRGEAPLGHMPAMLDE